MGQAIPDAISAPRNFLIPFSLHAVYNIQFRFVTAYNNKIYNYDTISITVNKEKSMKLNTGLCNIFCLDNFLLKLNFNAIVRMHTKKINKNL